MARQYSKVASKNPFRSFDHQRVSFANDRWGNRARINGIGGHEQILLDVHGLTSLPEQDGAISAFTTFAHGMELKTVGG